MARYLCILCTSIALALLAGSLAGLKPARAADDNAGRATSFAQCLVEGRFEDATASFDAVMLKAMPPEKLEQLWQTLLKQCGAFQRQGPARSGSEEGYDTVIIPCEFAQATLDLKLVYSKDGKLSGLWVLPHVPEQLARYSTPAYVHPDLYAEQEVTVGSGAWALPGTLTVPKGAGPFPALVLVHGSGPNDRDETVGANKPFCDLAQGLASQGVAVLRYDKRTKVYAAKLAASTAPFTVQDEVIDDALAAAELLRHTASIDPKRIYILGHSLGGMLIPRIGQADPQLAGLIVMAGPVRPLEDLLLEQVEYLSSLDGAPSAEAQAQLETIRRQVAFVKSPELKPDTPAAKALGAPGSYWLDLRGYQPAAVAQTLTQPLLIMQGGRDYQVMPAEFAIWQQALTGRPDVSFKLYPDLNHLFMEGTGKSTPQEYAQRGPIPPYVIVDLAAWIKAR